MAKDVATDMDGLNLYYQSKIEQLVDLMGTSNIRLKNNGVEIDDKFYPIINDVIVLLDPSQYPESLVRALGSVGT